MASQLCGLPFKPGAVLAAQHAAEEGTRVRAFPLLAAPPRLLSLLHCGKPAAVNRPGRLTVRLEGSADPPEVRAPTGPADPAAISTDDPVYSQHLAGIAAAASSNSDRTAAVKRPVVAAVEAIGTTPVAGSGGGSLWAALHSTAAQSARREQADCGTSPRPLHLSPPPICTAAASHPQAACRGAGHSLATPTAVGHLPQPPGYSRLSSSSSPHSCGAAVALGDVGAPDAATRSGSESSPSMNAADSDVGALCGHTAAVPTHAQSTNVNTTEAYLPAPDGTLQSRQPTCSQAAADPLEKAVPVHTGGAAGAQGAPGMLPLPAWQAPKVCPRGV